MKLLPIVLKHFKTRIGEEGKYFYVLPGKVIYSSYGVYYKWNAPSFQPPDGRLAFSGEVFLKVYTKNSMVELKDNKLVIDGKFELRPCDAPDVEERKFAPENAVRFEVATLLRDLKHVLFAVGNDPAVSAFNYVLFDVDGKRLAIVGTDGFRMSVVERNVDEFGAPFMLAKDQVKAMYDILKQIGTAEITFYRDGEYLIVLAEHETIAFKTTPPDFPDYRGLLERINKANAFLITDELREAVKRLKTIGTDKPVKLVFENGNVRIRYETVELGYNEVVSELTDGTFEDSVLFNPAFLHEALTSQKGGGKVWFSDSSSPFVFEFDETPEYFHVLMPIRKTAI